MGKGKGAFHEFSGKWNCDRHDNFYINLSIVAREIGLEKNIIFYYSSVHACDTVIYADSWMLDCISVGCDHVLYIHFTGQKGISSRVDSHDINYYIYGSYE